MYNLVYFNKNKTVKQDKLFIDKLPNLFKILTKREDQMN